MFVNSSNIICLHQLDIKNAYNNICICIDSIPTSDPEIEKLQNVLANNILFDPRITPDIVRFCIGKLKPHKDDVKYGFKSDHLINDTSKLFTVLFIMFKVMPTHVLTLMIYCDPLSYQYPTIVGVPRVQVIIIGAFLFLIVYANYLIMFLFIHTNIVYKHVICNLALSQIIHCIMYCKLYGNNQPLCKRRQ